jgi:hypothetical protein
MSQIACNLCFNIPFLFSDLLFSSQQKPASVDLPTSDIDLSPHLSLQYPYYPQGLTQKMYIVKGKICVVFAGREDEIKEFLKELKQRCNYFDADVPVERITEFMDEYPFGEKFARSALFLIHATQRDQKIHFGLFNVPKETYLIDPDSLEFQPGVWNIFDSPTLGRVYTNASGVERYLNLVKQLPELQTTAKKGTADYAVQANGIVAAQLLTLEKVALYTVNHLWGGGFEVGYFNGEGFDKLTNIAYIVCHSQFDHTGDVGIPRPRAVMFYRYIGEFLHITALELTDVTVYTAPDVVKFTARADQLVVRPFLVPTVDFDRSQPSPDINLSFKTNVLAIGFSLVTPNNSIFNPAFFKYGPQVFAEYNHGGKLDIYIHPGYIAEVRAGAKQAFPRL